MAPEQWTGRAVDPRTDVYAMGATLFHLLAGRPPFTAETRDELCLQHCNDPPPRLTSLDLGVSEAAERVVERALRKQPEDRYYDAGAMLRDIEALLHGQPSDLAIHPRLPDCDPHRVLEFEFRWELESTPRQLWPLVTNTDRLDRAIGFLPGKVQDNVTSRAAACEPSPKAAKPAWSKSGRSIRTNGSSRGEWACCASTARDRSGGWSASSS